MTRLKGDPLADSNVAGVDMPHWDLNELKYGEITAFTDTTVIITANDHEYKLKGHDFVFETNGPGVKLLGGTIENFQARDLPSNGSPHAGLWLYDFAMDVADFNAFVDVDDVAGFKAALFSGRDHMRGGAGIDHLTSFGGRDDVAGGDGDDLLETGAGDDHLQGDGGADVMIGGRGADNYQVNGAGDSGAGVYDTIVGFRAGQDHFMFKNVTGVDAQVDAGVATGPNVEGVLESSMDAGHLAAHHAALAIVEIGPSSSSELAQEVFLVVDQNGIAGYQSGEDIAVRLDHGRGLANLSLDDFLPPH